MDKKSCGMDRSTFTSCLGWTLVHSGLYQLTTWILQSLLAFVIRYSIYLQGIMVRNTKLPVDIMYYYKMLFRFVCPCLPAASAFCLFVDAIRLTLIQVWPMHAVCIS